MLQTETAAIAAKFGYVSPISSQEEYDEQYPAEVNYNPKDFDIDKKETHPKTGSVYLTERTSKARCYWRPYNKENRDLEGWYDVPSMGEMEEYCLQDALNPAGDWVEPDHPDSWPSILGVI